MNESLISKKEDKIIPLRQLGSFAKLGKYGLAYRLEKTAL